MVEVRFNPKRFEEVRLEVIKLLRNPSVYTTFPKKMTWTETYPALKDRESVNWVGLRMSRTMPERMIFGFDMTHMAWEIDEKWVMSSVTNGRDIQQGSQGNVNIFVAAEEFRKYFVELGIVEESE